MFATHYHELTQLEGQLYGVRNYCVAIKESGDDVIFLHKIHQGSGNQSYGIEVAKLAGLPAWVLERAHEILDELLDRDIAKKASQIVVLALSVIAAAQELGLSVPGELTVTGFDDLDYTTMMHPHLTTVAQPCHEMGRQSVDLLLDGLLDREEPSEQQIFLPYRLMERESAAAPDITA